MDYDHDGSWDNSDSALTGQIATVQIAWQGGSTTASTNAGNGSWSLNAQSNTYTMSIPNPPAGFQAMGSQTVGLGPANTNVNLGITPLYTISGTVYTDVNESLHYDGPDTPYAGARVTMGNQTVTSDASGHYSFSNLLSGLYQVTLTVPSGYEMSYPSPPTFTVTVGTPGKSPACSANGYNDASCDASGDITGLDFGITNSVVWHQVYCGDDRTDIGISVSIPSSANCGGTSGPHDIITSSTYCPSIDPSSGAGVVASGNVDPWFGQGDASTQGWQVGDSLYPETFQPRIQGAVTTSYGFITTSIKDSGLATTELGSVCNVNSCGLSGLPNGIYTHSGDVTLSSATLATTSALVVLIDGNLTLSGSLIAPPGAVDLFATTGNITVSPNVGEGSITSLSGDVEGLFTTDASFIVNSQYAQGQHCDFATGTGLDEKLNIQGAVITNAKSKNMAGGSFIIYRSLCKDNRSCPVTTVTARPDMLLNLPSLVLNTNNVFQEVAPGPGD